MYSNGYQPKVGDKVRRDCFDVNMAAGEEGVVCFVGEYGRVKITGKPDNAGFNEIFFTLLARAVRYADGNDAAVGDLVECVKRSKHADLAATAGAPGERFIVEEVHPRKDEIVPGMKITPADGSEQRMCHHDVNVDRFKLIARACPYKIGDWVHSEGHCIFGSYEFKVGHIEYDHDDWRLSDTSDGPKLKYSVFSKNVKPGRLPCPYQIGDWVKSKNSSEFEPEFRNRTFQVTRLYRANGHPWYISGRDVGTWDVKNVDPASPPVATGGEPISIADEVRAIIEQPWSLRLQTERLVDLIAAKTTNADKTIIELNEKVGNQKRELDAAAAKIQSLNDRNASQAKEIAGLLRNYADQQEKTRELIIAQAIERDQLNSRYNANLDYKALYENLRNKLREVAE